MTKKKYVPHPADTSTVKLDQDLLDLTEVIAENVHEVWSASRIKEGWTYGEQKDSVKKTTPCLVPYDELPEIEKQYDRDTAFGTIKLIIKLGYKINK